MMMMGSLTQTMVILMALGSQLPQQTVGFSPCEGTCRVPTCSSGDVLGKGECGLSAQLCCVPCIPMTHEKCTAPWIAFNGSCIFISTSTNEDRRNFAAAQEFCQQAGNGSDLATAGRGAAYGADTLLEYLFQTNPGDVFWLGAQRTGPSTYEWVDGRSLAVTSYLWHYNHPDDSDSLECVAVTPRYDSDHKRSYLWDRPCSSEYNFICEIRQ